MYQLVLNYQMVLKQFGKTINNNPEKYFTEDIMKQLDECAMKEFKYGNVTEVSVRKTIQNKD